MPQPTATVTRFSVRLVLLWAVYSGHAVADGGWQHGLSNFGTFKYPPGFSHFDYVNPNAPKGGRLVLAYGAAFNNFTPYITKGIGAPGSLVIGQMTLYDSLFWPSGDEVGVFYGNLAREVKVADDMTEVRLRHRFRLERESRLLAIPEWIALGKLHGARCVGDRRTGRDGERRGRSTQASLQA